MLHMIWIFLNLQKKKMVKKNKIILNVARFEKQKNHLMLLKSFKAIHKKINAKLILIGYGSEKKKYFKIYKKKWS